MPARVGIPHRLTQARRLFQLLQRRLDSVGGGLRALLPGFGFLEAMYARPLDKVLLLPEAGRAPDRLPISITAQFPRGGR